MVNIRPYQHADFEQICKWWEFHDEVPPLYGMMVEDGTFIAELNGKPVMTLTALTTQSKEISYFEGYCASPSIETSVSNEIGNILWDHCIQYLKNKGFKRVMLLCSHKKLMYRYQDLGMSVTMTGLYSLVREL